MIYYFQDKFLIAYVLICVFLLFFAIVKRQRHQRVFAVLGSILCVYAYFVIKMTQFPIYTGEIFAEDLGGHFWSSVNLVPFKGSLNLGSIQNIILTMPLGFLIPLLHSKSTSLKQIALIGFLTGFVLEALQLMQLLVNEFTFRVIDVNDLLFNFCGVLVGFFFFKVLRMIILLVNLRQPPEMGHSEIVLYFAIR